MTLKIGIVILARYNSSRLHGKALMKINGKPMLTYIVERLLQVVSTDQIVLATSVENTDDPIATYAAENGVGIFRGSLNNVAERFLQAANSQQWDYAIRINGDNIFVDTQLLKEMIDIARDGIYDFISNVKGRTFPKGMSIEIIRVSSYESVFPIIDSSSEFREHVTLYLYQHESSNHFYVLNKKLPEAAGLQMALDTAEDFERTENIINRFEKPHWHYNLEEIYTIWKSIDNGKTI